MLGINTMTNEVRRNFNDDSMTQTEAGRYQSFYEKKDWYTQTGYLIALSLLIVSLNSCKKNAVVAPTSSVAPTINKMVSSLAISNLLYHEDADENWFNSSYAKLQAAASYSITASTSQRFNGTRSVRFELKDTDAEVQSGTRAEMTFPIASHNTRWYSYVLYVPGSEYKVDATDEVISQWHQGGGTTPALCLRTKSDRLFLRILGDTWIDLGVLDKDRWHSYIMRVKHTAGSDGLIEMWRDGQKIIYRSGPNAYPINSTYHLPYWKIGIYKAYWNGSRTSSTSKRVLYFDDIKLGDEKAVYDDMIPIGNSTNPAVPNPTAPSTGSSGNAVTDLILVNAATEKDVLTIKDGQVISMSALGLKKVNIRANTTTTGSVKFQLTGKQSKTFIDSKAPYALHGDDGEGNFYYGNWNPPALGSYTLIATPYQSDHGQGTPGTAVTIAFTIKY